jgi:hypothetical protein
MIKRGMAGERPASLLHEVQLDRADKEHRVPRRRLLPVPMPDVLKDCHKQEGRGVITIYDMII